MKIKEHVGGGTRQRFIDKLGGLLRERLLADRSMSYPGHNGFSLRLDELDDNIDVKKILEEVVNYGELVDSHHTTKEKARWNRRKWYLNPILSPFYQVTVSHTKEPIYTEVDEVKSWLADAHVPGFEVYGTLFSDARE